MSSQTAPTPERPSTQLWIGAILVMAVGLFSGAIGLMGAIFELEPPMDYDIADPSAEPHYDAMRATNALCRLDDLEEVKGTMDCVLPLMPHDEPIEDYAEVSMMLMSTCIDIIDLVGDEAWEARKAVPCAPVGKSYPMDVHGEDFETSMKARYPGFTGEVMELPTLDDIEEKKDNRIIFLGMLGIGATGFLGGLAVMRILWRRRKRAHSGGG
jgi:hypothetical protein